MPQDIPLSPTIVAKIRALNGQLEALLQVVIDQVGTQGVQYSLASDETGMRLVAKT